jgi:hypothetical protein
MQEFAAGKYHDLPLDELLMEFSDQLAKLN